MARRAGRLFLLAPIYLLVIFRVYVADPTFFARKIQGQYTQPVPSLGKWDLDVLGFFTHALKIIRTPAERTSQDVHRAMTTGREMV